jgi:PIN domain nuclease of toxin-antitoxin system
LRLLLDTHALLWWLSDSPHLSHEARSAIKSSTAVYVSAATAWEISIKKARGKLEAPDDLEDVLRANRFEPLPITMTHACAAGSLPAHHRDPFDRMLVAQARAESLTLVTRDESLKKYGVRVLTA